jgi:hypothetical protein
MIAKVIAHGNTRGEAILRMRRALESFVVEGIKTNVKLSNGSSPTRISSAAGCRRASWSGSLPAKRTAGA